MFFFLESKQKKEKLTEKIFENVVFERVGFVSEKERDEKSMFVPRLKSIACNQCHSI